MMTQEQENKPWKSSFFLAPGQVVSLAASQNFLHFIVDVDEDLLEDDEDENTAPATDATD